MRGRKRFKQESLLQFFFFAQTVAAAERVKQKQCVIKRETKTKGAAWISPTLCHIIWLFWIEMFPSDEFWRSLVFFVFGGIIAVLSLKSWEAEEREKRGRQGYALTASWKH